MEEQTKYFVLKQKAVPEVLLKVVEAKRLIDSERALTIQEATEKVGISRSSFYKYKDDIFPFYENAKGRTITMVLQMDDEQGLLSDLLHIVAVYRANILTIHQSIPVSNVATLTLSVEVRPDTGDISGMVGEMVYEIFDTGSLEVVGACRVTGYDKFSAAVEILEGCRSEICVFVVARAEHDNISALGKGCVDAFFYCIEAKVVDDFITCATKEVGRELGACQTHGQIADSEHEHFGAFGGRFSSKSQIFEI